MRRLWLLAEDDDVDALSMGRALRELGADVDVERVTDGEAALERLKSGGARYALAVLDINMPRLSGIEVLSGLPRPGVRAVVLSTTSDEQERAECLRRGAAGVFVKAADHGVFLDTVRRILEIESRREP